MAYWKYENEAEAYRSVNLREPTAAEVEEIVNRYEFGKYADGIKDFLADNPEISWSEEEIADRANYRLSQTGIVNGADNPHYRYDTDLEELYLQDKNDEEDN